MKYESYIKLAFARLGYSPRDNQVAIINTILVEFLDNKKKNVVLDSPTGAGKSIIGAVTAEVISEFRKNNPLNAIFLSSTNILLDQYDASFPNFLVMKGADNYLCPFKSLGPLKVKAANCLKKTKFFEKEGGSKAKCASCEYQRTRARKNVDKNVITNYAFYFIDRLFMAMSEGGGDFNPRNIIVWDEAHLINESFVSHCTIYFSKERFDEYIKEIQQDFPERINEFIKQIRKPMELIASDKVTQANLKEILDDLGAFYSCVRDLYLGLREDSDSYKEWTAYNEKFEKYKGLFCKINNYNTYGFEVVIDVTPKTMELKVDPIFVSTMFTSICNSEFNLFMSGTLSKEFMTQTLDLEDKDTAFVRSPNVFPIETKTVVMRKEYMMKLNYQTMNEAGTYQSLGSKITHILSQHQNDSGVIFAPSFAFVKVIKNHIRSEHEVIAHETGALLPLLKKFKNTSFARPRLIISPSMYEGVDLPGDISRFQIMAKAPYASLGDKRMKYILDHYPDMYQLMTIMRVIQGIGRSTRYDGDHCRTYFLDTNLKNLFENYNNIWQQQFLSSYC